MLQRSKPPLRCFSDQQLSSGDLRIEGVSLGDADAGISNRTTHMQIWKDMPFIINKENKKTRQASKYDQENYLFPGLLL